MKQPTNTQKIMFFIKSRYFIAKRFLRDLSDQKKHDQTTELIGQHFVAESISQLRTSTLVEHQELQDGKIHNLRIACKQLNGLRILKNEEFSFWKALGRPTTEKGYTTGREIRYGCVIPTIAGGLCQLSGGLYEAAIRAGFLITERHAHTATTEEMDIPESRDCTIFWNYVDFRFRPHVNISIVAEVTENDLRISFFSDEHCIHIESRQQNAPFSMKKTIESCETCQEYTCEQKQKLHAQKILVISSHLSTNEKSFLLSQSTRLNLILIPQRPKDFWRLWWPEAGLRLYWRSLSLRFWTVLMLSWWRLRKMKTVAEKSIVLWNLYGELLAPQLKALETQGNLVIDQRLLCRLWQHRALVTLKYNVLFRHLPMMEMEQRLSELSLLYPDDRSLIDFRAPTQMLKDELSALHSAQKLYTEHDELSELLPRAHSLVTQSKTHTRPKEIDWQLKYLLFPGPSLTREGKHAAKELAQQKQKVIALLSSDQQDPAFWSDVPHVYFQLHEIPWNEVIAVVHFTVFEGKTELHQMALEKEVPILGTRGLGLHLTHPIHLREVGYKN